MSRPFHIFDLDGTISDPSVGIGGSLNYAVQHYGYSTIPEDDVSQFIGPPLDQTFRSIVGSSPAEHIGALVAKYRERCADVGYSENVIYSGISEALKALDAADVPLGLCTSKRADFAEDILSLLKFGNTSTSSVVGTSASA